MGKQASELQKQVTALRNKMAAESAGTIARFAAIQKDLNEKIDHGFASLREELEAQASRNNENLNTFLDILTAQQERERAARAEWEAAQEARQADLEAKFEARFQSIEKRLAS